MDAFVCVSQAFPTLWDTKCPTCSKNSPSVAGPSNGPQIKWLHNLAKLYYR